MKVKLTIFILILATQAFCQEFVQKKSVYIELGGSAGFGSVNYENIFNKNGKIDLLWRIGISGFPIDKNAGFVFIIPTTISGLIGKKNHKIELGIGQGISMSTKGRFFSLTTPVIGYRYQNAGKRFFYRVSYTPLISYILDFQYQNWLGISIGYNLNSMK
ncbi:MAG: hypothetical protein GXO79_14765 [Chlorobi bacterium]|nr:hypothetical protein [Chlorobiota bacterium]